MWLVIHYRHPDPNVPDGTIIKEAGYTFRVGRSVSAAGHLVDIDLHWDKAVSRNHALLYFDNGSWWVRDDDSTYGTRKGDQVVTEALELPPGSEIKMGDTTLRLEYDAPHADAGDQAEGGIIGDQMTLDPAFNAVTVSETDRIRIMARLAALSRLNQGEAAMHALVGEIRAIFTQRADHVGILLYADKEPLPIAFHPPEKAYFSNTLVRRAIQEMSAFVWERSTLAGAGEMVASLRDVTCAMYAPIVHNRKVRGVIHVDSTSADLRFSKDELALLSEVASTTGLQLLDGLQPSDKVSKVFLSYSRADQAFVRQLAGDLRKHVISVWFDERLRAGQDWREQVQRVIEMVDVCVLAISPDSLESKNVAWELDYIAQMNKPLLPILVRPAPFPENLSYLRSKHYINLHKDYQQGLANLIDDLPAPKT
jgi:hypothetical protein